MQRTNNLTDAAFWMLFVVSKFLFKERAVYVYEVCGQANSFLLSATMCDKSWLYTLIYIKKSKLFLTKHP